MIGSKHGSKLAKFADGKFYELEPSIGVKTMARKSGLTSAANMLPLAPAHDAPCYPLLQFTVADDLNFSLTAQDNNTSARLHHRGSVNFDA